MKIFKTKKVKSHLIQQKVHILFFQNKYDIGCEKFGGAFTTKEKAIESGKYLMEKQKGYIIDFRVSETSLNKIY